MNSYKPNDYPISGFAPLKLELPMDWHHKEIKNIAFQWSMHCLGFLISILNDKQESLTNLDFARDIVLSWYDEFYGSSKRLSYMPKYIWNKHATAIRAKNLSIFYNFDKEYINQHPDFKEVLELMLHEHGTMLEKDWFYERHHNHGLDESFSLYRIGFTLTRMDWINMGKQRLLEEVSYAISDEGVHIENSPAYHVRHITILNNIYEFIKNNDPELKKLILIMMKKALEFCIYIIRPDARPPIIGDSEFFPLGSLPNLKLIKMLDNYQDFTYISSCAKDSKIPIKSPQKVYVESGYAIFRDKWHPYQSYKDTLHLIIKTGALSLAHHHYDEGSFTLYAFGEDWIIDSGLHDYNEASPKRIYCRSAVAHNKIYLKNSPKITNQELLRPHIISYSENIYYPYIEFKYYLTDNIVTNRGIYLNTINNNIYIEDNLQLEDPNTVYYLIHIPKDKTIRINSNKIFVTSTHKTMLLTLDVNIQYSINVIRGFDKNREINSFTSFFYNECFDSQCIVISFTNIKSLILNTSIIFITNNN